MAYRRGRGRASKRSYSTKRYYAPKRRAQRRRSVRRSGRAQTVRLVIQAAPAPTAFVTPEGAMAQAAPPRRARF